MPQFERFGHYILLEELSSYYFGKSYRAGRISDKKFGDHIILLKINPELSDNHEFIKNLQEEIALCMDLDHPNILRTLGIGKIHDTFYITRQFIPGQPLKNTLQMCTMKDSPLTVDHALFVAAKLCQVLELTHSHQSNGKNLIHGNLSTTRVILSYDGQVNLSGFGLTSILLYLPEWKERILLRKDEYLSPEQMTGRQIDHRSDIFTAGVILFEMLTGDPFFLPGRGINLKTRIDSVRVGKSGMASSRISDGIIHVLEKSVVSDPDDRYQDIKEMRIDLETSLITDNFHASTSTLGNALKALFHDEIAEKQKQMEQERRFDLSEILMDYQNSEKDSAGDIIEAMSDENVSVHIQEIDDQPGGESGREPSSIEEKALVAEDEELPKESRSDRKKKDFFSRISTPILVVGLLIILLLIVFYFILGRTSGGPEIKPKDQVSLQAPGDRQIPNAWKGITGAASDRVIPESIATGEPAFSGGDQGDSLNDETPLKMDTEQRQAGESFSQDSGETIPSVQGPLISDRPSQDDISQNQETEEPSASMETDIPSPAPETPVLQANPGPAQDMDGEAAQPAQKNGIEATNIQHISDIDLRTTGDADQATLDTGRTEMTRVEFPVELPAVPVLPDQPVIEPPVMTRYSPPDYSSLARQLKITGTLHLDLLISAEGKVLETQVAETPENRALDKGGIFRSVIKAAKKWEFEPATRDGEAFEKWHRINFRINAE